MSAHFIAEWYHNSSTVAAKKANKDAAASKEDDRKTIFDAQNENGEDTFEYLLRVYANEPCLKLIPTWVTPNSITLVNNVLCMFLVYLSYLAIQIEDTQPVAALLCRFGSGFLCTANMVLDCLDGMKARRDKQSSHVGEVLDHSLDAFNIPLLAASLLISMIQDDKIGGLVSMIGACCVYNAQLVLYRYHQVMIVPPVSGPLAQFMCSVAHVAIGIILYVVPRDWPPMYWAYVAFMAGSTWGQLSNTWFFIAKLHTGFVTSRVFPHILFTVSLLPMSIYYYLGWIGMCEYCFLLSAISFRLNGRFLLSTLLTFKNKGNKYRVTLLPYCNWTNFAMLGLGIMSAGRTGTYFLDDYLDRGIYDYTVHYMVFFVASLYAKFWYEVETYRVDL